MALTDNLVSYWKMDEASGNALDAHGTNDLTDTNTVGTSASGLIGNARDFVRSNSEYFTLADNADLSTGDIDFTYTCWVKSDLFSSNADQILCKKTSTSSIFEHQLFSNAGTAFKWQIGNGTSSVGTVSWSSTPSTATWYFVVVWHDATNNQVGIQVNNGTAVTAATTGSPADTAAPFSIGSGSGNATQFWDGLIDEVGFWKRLLTTQEKTDLYNSGAGLSYDSFTAGGATTMAAAAGSFIETGVAATLKAARKIAATAASFTLTGQTATLAGPGAKTLTAAAGSFALTGQDIGLEVAVPAGLASFTLTGQAATLKAGRKLAAAAGAHTLTGQDVTFIESQSYTLSAAVAAFALSGKAVRFDTNASPWGAVSAASGTWTPKAAASGEWSAV